MKSRLKKIVVLWILFLLSSFSFSKEIKEDFDDLNMWKDFTFKKIENKSKYIIDRGILRTSSNNSASGIIYQETFNPYETPIIKWKWRIENIYEKGDSKIKSGDDFPLRIYITFRYDPETASFNKRIKYLVVKKLYGEYPPHSALNYVWDSKNTIGEVVINPYVSSSREILIQAGRENLMKWIEEERNILEDYYRAFGEYPPKEASIAIMNDSDNTGESAKSYLDYIYILKEGKK